MQFRIKAGEFEQIEISEKRKIQEITFVDIQIRQDEKRIPQKCSISFSLSCPQIVGTFSPCIDFDRSVNSGWKAGRIKSRYVYGMPLYCAYSTEGKNEFTVTLSDGNTPIEMSAMVNEENGQMEMTIHLFTDVTPEFEEYHLQLRIDQRKLPFYEAVAEASAWQREFTPKRVYPVADASKDAVYSTWYSFHRTINEGEVLEECKAAVQRGIKTLILDDGWYSDEADPQFFYCGDYTPAKGKFPDMKGFVEKVHELGMKVMIWFSVPYLGGKSKLYERFSDMQIRREKNWNCLDFRFPEVRDYLYDMFIKAAKEWNLDGMKLDFIDSLYIEKGFDRPAVGHDCTSLEEGMDCFLNRLIPGLKEVNPDFMVEFRQYYIGNPITRFADMIRVNDCPYDALRNRTAILGLRMICGEVPVHSDMIRWSRETPVEDAAQQIVSSLFSVLQISVREKELTVETKKMLDFYLKFSQENRRLLLEGKLSAKHPEMNYTEAAVMNENEQIKVFYTPALVQAGDFEKETLINGSESSEWFVSTKDQLVRYEIYDCMGNRTGNGEAEAGSLFRVTVPRCGMIVFTSKS